MQKNPTVNEFVSRRILSHWGQRFSAL